jgi:hypothetical protein
MGHIIGRALTQIPSPNHLAQPESGVKVEITGPSGMRVMVSDGEGIYDAPGLPPGRYSVHVGAAIPLGQGRTNCPSPFQLEGGQIMECDVRFSKTPPETRARITGRVISFIRKGDHHAEGGINVEIAGPSGIIRKTTDDNGVFDAPGLLPGWYKVQFDGPTPLDDWHTNCPPSIKLEGGQAVECDMWFNKTPPQQAR